MKNLQRFRILFSLEKKRKQEMAEIAIVIVELRI